MALNEHPQLQYDLEYLSDFALSEYISPRAQTLLEMKFGKSEAPDFLPLFTPSSMLIQNEYEEESEIIESWKVISIYPNPSTGVVYFDFPDIDAGHMKIEVISLDGKVMAQLEVENTNGEKLDLSHLQKGFFLVKTYIDNNVVSLDKLELF